jgi:hypothetical protein
MGDIVAVIRSRAGGSDEARRGLCYDKHHVLAVTVTVTIPDQLPCVLRGRFYQEKLPYSPLVERFRRKICPL